MTVFDSCEKRRKNLTGIARRWRSDERGTSLLTTALTLPVLAVLFLGIYYLFIVMSQKLALNNGVTDAAKYISENARYWNIDPTGRSGVAGDLLPADYYDQQARRIVESRLRDTILYSDATLSETLTVWVEEPLLAYAPGSTQEPVASGDTAMVLCDPDHDLPGEWRDKENVRFRVYARFKIPFFIVRIPYMDAFTVTISDRAIGYVQCPRWKGKREQGDYDKSRWIAAEGPAFVFRALSTPAIPPTVTGTPPPTATSTRIPTPTPRP